MHRGILAFGISIVPFFGYFSESNKLMLKLFLFVRAFFFVPRRILQSFRGIFAKRQ